MWCISVGKFSERNAKKKELLFINTLIKGCDYITNSSETVLFWQKVLKVGQWDSHRQERVNNRCVCVRARVCVCVKLLQRCILMATFDFPVTHSALNLKPLYMCIAQSLIIKTSWESVFLFLFFQALFRLAMFDFLWIFLSEFSLRMCFLYSILYFIKTF